MITPPSTGTFSTPTNSIFHKTRLKTPTVGRSISSAHCGNIGPISDTRISFLLGNVSELFKSSGHKALLISLQRPLVIDEFHVHSRNAVRAGAARADRRMNCQSILLARDPNKAAD